MRAFISVRTCILLFGFGAALLLTPACKAQSEVSPDHFDGTDSWATATRTVQPPKHKQAVTSTAVQTQTQRNAQAAAFQLASAREATKAGQRDAAVVDRKRKTANRNPDKK